MAGDTIRRWALTRSSGKPLLVMLEAHETSGPGR